MTNTQKCLEAADELKRLSKTLSDMALMSDRPSMKNLLNTLSFSAYRISEDITFPEPANVDGDDSKRLDWLADNFCEVCPTMRGQWQVLKFNGIDSTSKISQAASIRQAIDAAMNKSQ